MSLPPAPQRVLHVLLARGPLALRERTVHKPTRSRIPTLGACCTIALGLALIAPASAPMAARQLLVTGRHDAPLIALQPCHNESPRSAFPRRDTEHSRSHTARRRQGHSLPPHLAWNSSWTHQALAHSQASMLSHVGALYVSVRCGDREWVVCRSSMWGGCGAGWVGYRWLSSG